MLLEKNDRLIMAGDSVTDCGRLRESLPGGWGSFGDGYVNFVDGFLAAMYPELHLLVGNAGVSGNDVVDLQERYEKDVLAYAPKWVSVMIGINDVWRHYDGMVMPVRKVELATFQRIYESLVVKTLEQEQVKGMILISPVMIEANDANPMKCTLREYAKVARDLADKYSDRYDRRPELNPELPFGCKKPVIYVDAQSKVDAFLAEGMNEYILCSDRVHPNNKGHAIITKAFLDAIGVDWKKG